MFPSIMLALWQFPVLKNSKQINEVTKRNLLIRVITLLCITQLIVFMTSNQWKKNVLKNICIFYFWLWSSLLLRLSLVVVIGGCSLVLRHRLLIVAASIAVLHGLYGAWASAVAACGLHTCGSQALKHSSLVMAHGLSCSITYGIFPAQGSNLHLLHWQADSSPLDHQG